MEWLTWQGIRALADAIVAKDKIGVRYVSRRNKRQQVPLSPGDVLYARDTWREPWRSRLRDVPVPCVLLTAFSDAHVQPHALTLLERNIRHWFAVQVNVEHPRLTAMPIGIDGRDVDVLTAAPQARTRDIVCLSNFQPRNDERLALWKWSRAQPWITTDRWGGALSPFHVSDYYARLGRSRFVLSPPGRGWDCYRTYEAIAMGAIPIVRRQRPISDVVDGLPVVVVDDWSEVTPARLEAEWRAHRPRNLERLSLDYWRTRIEREVQSVANQ